MKRFLTALALSLACVVSFGATTTPVQLLNPTGSTAGQAILSTGPTSAPAWGTVTLGGVSGTLAITNGGTGATTQSAALSNILGSSAVPIANGGTGAATQSAALANLLSTSVIGVANGGTGAASLTAHGVLVGEGTSALTTIGPGANGQMLLGVTSADPYWGNNPAISGGTVDNSPIGNTTASSGKFTTVNATGLITPSSTTGIKGTATNDSANAGSVGEYVTNTTTGTSLTTNIAANATSASLTAGDWDVECSAKFTAGATTTIGSLAIGSSTTSATFAGVGTETLLTLTFTTGGGNYLAGPVSRYSLASTTTVYCPAFATFGTSTMAVDGLIRARRIR